MTGRQ